MTMFEPVLVSWSGSTLWILGVALKGSVVLLLVLLVVAALRRASAGLRHLVWGGGIAAVLLLPALSFVLPWQLPLASLQVPAASPMTLRVETSAPAAEGSQNEPVGSAPGLTSHSSETSERPSRTAQLPWLLVIWGAGVLFFIGRLAFGTLLLRRIVKRATPLDSFDWTHPLIEGADRLAVARLPRLLADDSVPMPVVCGVLCPTIVVPAGAGEWTDRRRRAVLCHELAHIRRFDIPANLISRLACALHWFNPLVWVAARQLRAESERACDDLVLGVGTRPSEYADHLLQIVGGARHGQAPAVAIPLAQRREFEGRMLAILDEDTHRGSPSRRHAAALVALAILLLMPIAAMAPTPAASVPSPSLDASSPLLAALIEGLDALQADERADAANALGTLDESAAVGPLGELLLSDPDANVRYTAAWALGQIASPGAIERLGAAAVDDDSAEVRGMAVWALGQIADPAGLPALETALDDASYAVRNRAAWAIGNVGPSSAPPSLVTALNDTDESVRETAAWALGQIGDPSSVPALTVAAQDEFTKASLAALRSLAQIGGAAALPTLRDALGSEHLDTKLRDAIERALAGESVERQPRSWAIPAIR